MWNRRLALLLGVLIAVRVLFIAFAPLDLSPDEAYYWDWSRHLDWGYYSKPPMIAWIIAAGTSIFGNNAMGVRLPAAILATLGVLAVYLLGRRLFGAKAGFLAALATAFMPGSCVLGFAMTIDAPLIFSWAWAMYATWLALEKKGYERDQGTACWWWTASGVFTGLGILSKQTMLAFPPFVFLFLILEPDYRKRLLTPWPYLAFIISLAPLGPVIWWNYRHGWITLEHTAHHFEMGSRSYFTFLKTLPDFILSQLGLISPVTWILSMITSYYILFMALKRHISKKNGNVAITSPTLYLAVLSAAPIALTTLLSLKQRVNGNWPAPFYLGSSVLLGGWAAEVLNLTPWIDRFRRLFKPGLILGASMCAILYIIPWAACITNLDKGRIDLTAELRGWRELGITLGEIAKKNPVREMLIIGTKRQLTSELAFYVPGQPRTYRWAGEQSKVKSQYELWHGPCDKIGHDAIIVTYADEQLPQDIKGYFKEIRPLYYLRPAKNGFNLYLGKGLIDWPGCSASKVQGRYLQPGQQPLADQVYR
ncbi:MAG: ArnT family glycosyltransferase [Dissulfurimicrobium sp.]|uniref:ArnT family glycosyltransferase n=1 Tax=Dissulfurimicrobium TaxID=1769732 RepID=UPI003C74FD9C